ncbi:hypothetical protein F4810DRAFT_503553 [Camillea tinctor]|nr:hypothetical protein F4810DRAFT_503553 [Camillea tinctor]
MPEPTPTPYEVGRSLDLIITRGYEDYFHREKLSVAIEKTFEVSQSPVMVVTFDTPSGPMKAVLKLYDRRFGPSFRTIEGTYSPHTSENEAIWQEYINQGNASALFDRIEEDQVVSVLRWSPNDYYEDSWKGRAQFEGGQGCMMLR